MLIILLAYFCLLLLFPYFIIFIDEKMFVDNLKMKNIS